MVLCPDYSPMSNSKKLQSPSVDPMMKILSEKKKKKMKKESFEEEAEMLERQDKKKKKKHQKELVDRDSDIPSSPEKKKKKDKIIDHESDGLNQSKSLERTFADEDIDTEAGQMLPEKKKKKSKNEHLEETVNGSSFITTPGKKKKRAADSELTSPSKKTKETEGEKKREREKKGETTSTTVWSKEESEELLTRIEQALPKNDELSYRRRLHSKKWDWTKVCFGYRTPDECREQFNILLEPTVKYKTLGQVVQSAKDILKKPTKKMHKYNEFVSNFVKKMSNENYEMSEILSMASKEWNKMGIKRQPRKRKTGRTPAEFLGVELCPEAKLTQDVYRKLREKYEKLKPKAKIKYIRESCKEIFEFEREANGGEVPEHRPKRMPKIDDVILLLEEEGMPPVPAKSAVSAFYYELVADGKLDDVEGPEKLFTASRLFNLLSDDEKLKREKRHKRLQEEYNYHYTSWVRQQEDYIRFWAEIVRDLKVKGKQAKREKKVKGNQIVSVMNCPKFTNEPKMPPRTGYNLFCIKFEQRMKGHVFKTKREKLQKCGDFWRNLTPEQKLQYKKRLEAMSKVYEAELMLFLANLRESERKLYIGFNRKRLKRFFGYDVLHDKYPNDQYPDYVLGTVSKDRDLVEEKRDFSDSDLVITPYKKATKVLTKKQKKPDPSDSDSSDEEEKLISHKTIPSKDGLKPDSSESSTSDEDEDEKDDGKRNLTKKEEPNSSESSSSDESDEVPPVKTSAQKMQKQDPNSTKTVFKKTTNVKKVTQPPTPSGSSDDSDSGSDSESSEEENKSRNLSKVQRPKGSERSNKGNEEDSEDDFVDIKPSWHTPKQISRKEEPSEEDDSDEESSSD